MTFTLLIGGLLFGSCAKKDPTAGLNELPRESALKLQSVPNAKLLATKVEQTNPGTPPGPVALCPKDWIFTYFDAQVTMPITICTNEEEKALRENAWFFSGSTKTATTKLVDPSIFAGLEDGVLWQPPLVCRTTDGPWLVRITQERACIGTCTPLNTLVVVGAPNPVQFVWHGSFENHPAGFEFVGKPVQTDQANLGPCNGSPVTGQLIRP
jgi:hypothetical protein